MPTLFNSFSKWTAGLITTTLVLSKSIGPILDNYKKIKDQEDNLIERYKYLKIKSFIIKSFQKI